MNQMNPAFVMPDVQSTVDTRQIPIQRVGVKGVRHPLTVRTATGDVQPTVGTWNLDVRLPADQKGTHMSRFVALLEGNKAPLEPSSFRKMLTEMLDKLEATGGRIEVTFPVLDPANKKRIVDEILGTELSDNAMSWELEADGRIRALNPRMRSC